MYICKYRNKVTKVILYLHLTDCFNNNNSVIFNGKNTHLNDCLNTTTEPCEMCKDQYLDLNNFYINLDQHNNGEVCFDLQDSVSISDVCFRDLPFIDNII